MTPEEKSAADAAAAVASEEQQKKIQDTVAAEVTKAVTAALAAQQKTLQKEFAKFQLKPEEHQETDAEKKVREEAEAAAAGNPEIAKLQRSVRELTERTRVADENARTVQTKAEEKEKKAEEKDRFASIRSSLGDFQFANDEAREDAFRTFRDEIKRGDDGELYGGEFVPLKDYIKARMAVKTHLLAPREVDSAGARQHQQSDRGGRAVQFEDIKVGMDPKARNAAWAAVADLIKQ